MAPTPESLAAIRSEMNALSSFKEPNMKFDAFSGENGRYLAQMKIDKPALLKAGMSEELMTKFMDYNYVLTNEHALRLIHEGTGSPELVEFNTRLETSMFNLDCLKATLQYIMDEHKDDSVRIAYKKIMKGSGIQAKLNDIISFATLVEEHLDLAAEIKPDGKEINQEYITAVREDTYDMLRLYATVQSTTPDRTLHVDAQNRIITLCINAETKLKNYAKAAFVSDKEYYTEHYVNHVFRERNKANQRQAEAEISEEE